MSIFFDAIESLLFPMTWQHTIIPALPISRKTFLDAPTPYLIGLLLNPDIENRICEISVSKSRKRSKSCNMRKKSFSDSFLRSLSHNHQQSKETEHEDADRLSLRSSSSNNKRPISEPLFSSDNDLTDENSEEFQFWSDLLQGKHDLPSDSLIIHIGKRPDTRTKNPLNIDSEKLVYFANILKEPSDGVSLVLPHSVLEMIKKRFNLFVKSLLGLPFDLESEEVTKGKFVILCETFLHMYNAIFGRLEEYLDSKDIWKVTNNANKSFNDEYLVEHCFNVSCNHKCIY